MMKPLRHLMTALLFATAVFAEPSSNALTRILSPDAHPAFAERHHLLHQLSTGDLRPRARDLIEFLRRDTPPPGMIPDDFLSLKNDVSSLLSQHNLLPAEHLALAIDTILDSKRDEIWRDYCLQALPALLRGEGTRSHDLNRARILLDNLTQGEVPRLTGTALLSAHRMLDEGPAKLAPAPGVLAARALVIAQDQEAPLIDRVTALQVAAMLEAPGVFDYAAAHSSELGGGLPDMLHVSAFAALGYSRDPAHIPLLEQHRLSPDIRLRAAARSAIQRLQN